MQPEQFFDPSTGQKHEKNTASPLFAKLEMPATAAERITEAGLIIRWRGFELILSDHRDISLATQFIQQLSQS